MCGTMEKGWCSHTTINSRGLSNEIEGYSCYPVKLHDQKNTFCFTATIYCSWPLERMAERLLQRALYLSPTRRKWPAATKLGVNKCNKPYDNYISSLQWLYKTKGRWWRSGYVCKHIQQHKIIPVNDFLNKKVQQATFVSPSTGTISPAMEISYLFHC